MSEIRYKKAAALSYEGKKDIAPKVTASGKGYVAENIINKAKENNVPIQEDSSLVALLSELNINESIPEELYLAVAEVFAFIYQADKNIKL
ncbi:EscU/YscU/HrcU family type III secretion system export apparatus switch protein [Aquibacillus rhizosphaerae]|uniref:EscU/YscU/HrcU family type III secretion system export apparatus switch protein n=1 Tax=Aquibacillus rhizosphaerae TaxID=3051431 RepID=A0ABT7L2I7_9BACI|nr:EscU/YscU/HrcU family type III secretion system export apparatus switch protein [Aquibacillus sp. LR5S19]MDL4840047.1 EscU/YscU/HrcU family type III secretion system export apparatus switch protein [Aquibacillus sp. LR5S19]